jgi:hypothetical protein
MRTINSTIKFSIGQKVKVFKTYVLGNTSIKIGSIGKIVDIHILNLPDLMLFNIRVLDVDFDGEIISAAEDIINNHMKII